MAAIVEVLAIEDLLTHIGFAIPSLANPVLKFNTKNGPCHI